MGALKAFVGSSHLRISLLVAVGFQVHLILSSWGGLGASEYWRVKTLKEEKEEEEGTMKQVKGKEVQRKKKKTMEKWRNLTRK